MAQFDEPLYHVWITLQAQDALATISLSEGRSFKPSTVVEDGMVEIELSPDVYHNIASRYPDLSFSEAILKLVYKEDQDAR